MKFYSLGFVVGISSLNMIAGALADSWDGYNNPANISRAYRYNLDALPLTGKLPPEKQPWSETYWPSYQGGIAVRWQTGETGFQYGLYSKEQLIAMGPAKVALLSPAEKFDILHDRYDYPTVQGERNRVSPENAHWEGICHGWTPASLLHSEPKPKTFVNRAGIEVRFGSSDIKALISYYYGVVRWKPSGWIGKRCSGGGLFGGGRGCRGVNAGTLHVVLTNQLGLMGRGFIADVDRGKEVWNQPVYAYNSQIIGQGRDEVVVQTEMYYANELTRSQWEPSVQPVAAKAVYRYTLELNAGGQITGGNWQSKTRPGFLWQHDTNDFAHPYYGAIKDLLNDPVPAGEVVPPVIPALADVGAEPNATDAATGSALTDDEIMGLAREWVNP